MGALEKEKIDTANNLRVHSSEDVAKDEWTPSGFRRRFLAFSIDATICGFLEVAALWAIFTATKTPNQASFSSNSASISYNLSEVSDTTMLLINLSTVVVGFLYVYISMTKWSATPGKKVLGLKVIRLNKDEGWGFFSIFLREYLGKFFLVYFQHSLTLKK